MRRDGRKILTTAHRFVSATPGATPVYALVNVDHPEGLEIDEERYRKVVEMSAGGLFEVDF